MTEPEAPDENERLEVARRLQEWARQGASASVPQVWMSPNDLLAIAVASPSRHPAIVIQTSSIGASVIAGTSNFALFQPRGAKFGTPFQRVRPADVDTDTFGGANLDNDTFFEFCRVISVRRSNHQRLMQRFLGLLRQHVFDGLMSRRAAECG